MYYSMKNFTDRILAQNASDSRVCKHLYLRGNHQQDMSHDKIDKINVWNRLWLSAKATGVEIISVEILDSHLHLIVLLRHEGQETEFMHHFRLSITQYYNRRYELKGMLGTRKFGRATLYDAEDLKDCVCYHIRNVVHHGISSNYLDYPFSTARYVFGLVSKMQRGHYTSETLPDNLAHAYLPIREKLPEGWTATSEGLIVPPERVFRSDIVEELFGGSREKYLEVLSHRTRREANDEDEPCAKRESLESVQTPDEMVVEFAKKKSQIPLPAMSFLEKIEILGSVREEFPKVSYKSLERIFGIPSSTIRYHIKKLRGRE